MNATSGRVANRSWVALAHYWKRMREAVLELGPAILCLVPTVAYAGISTGTSTPGKGGPDNRIPCNYYVAPSGGSDSNPGTSIQPFATIGKLQTTLQSSSRKVGCLKAGTYDNVALSLGAIDSNEYWESDPASPVNSAILNGRGSIPTAVNCTGDNYTWNAIAITNYTRYGITGSSSCTGFTVENSDLGNVGSALGGMGQSSVISAQAHWTIRYNYIHDSASGGITFWAYKSGDSYNGTVIDANVILNVCQTQTDCGAIYGNARNNYNTAGSVAITNNFIRDCGSAANHTSCNDLYYDDDASNITATGNILGPLVQGDTVPNQSCIAINGGTSNTYQNNICDIGFTKAVPIAEMNPCGTGGTIACSEPGNPNTWSQNIIVANFSGSFNSRYFGHGGHHVYIEYYCTANGAFPGTASQWVSISNNLYRQYGSGNMPTSGGASMCGTLINDTSPITETDPQISGYLYDIAGDSPVFSAPLNFVDVSQARSAGPPGFVIPTSTNHSSP